MSQVRIMTASAPCAKRPTRQRRPQPQPSARSAYCAPLARTQVLRRRRTQLGLTASLWRSWSRVRTTDAQSFQCLSRQLPSSHRSARPALRAEHRGLNRRRTGCNSAAGRRLQSAARSRACNIRPFGMCRVGRATCNWHLAPCLRKAKCGLKVAFANPRFSPRRKRQRWLWPNRDASVPNPRRRNNQLLSLDQARDRSGPRWVPRGNTLADAACSGHNWGCGDGCWSQAFKMPKLWNFRTLLCWFALVCPAIASAYA